MNIIPIDVGNIIMNFLYFTRDFQNSLFINKFWNKLIKNSLFLQKYLNLKENLYMYLEDERKNDFPYLKNHWEQYNSWKWGKSNNITIVKNQYVDVLDKVDCWCPAIIKNITIFPDFNETVFEKKMKVEFLGWNNTFDETVNIERIKPFGTKTINPKNKYESIKKIKETCWVLFKPVSYINYYFAKIKPVEINEKNIIVKIDSALVKLTKKNIDNLIKTPTNANALIFKDKHYDLYMRNFKF